LQSNAILKKMLRRYDLGGIFWCTLIHLVQGCC